MCGQPVDIMAASSSGFGPRGLVISEVRACGFWPIFVARFGCGIRILPLVLRQRFLGLEKKKKIRLVGALPFAALCLVPQPLPISACATSKSLRTWLRGSKAEAPVFLVTRTCWSSWRSRDISVP